MMLSPVIRESAPSCRVCLQALLAGAGWGSAGQQRARHFVPAINQDKDGTFDAEESYKHWRNAWKGPKAPLPKQRPQEAPRSVALTPEERKVLQGTAEQLGLYPRTARRVVVAALRGVAPIDPLAIADRIRCMEELSLSPERLLSTAEGPSLLALPPRRLRSQVGVLQRVLPEYSPSSMLFALPRWSVQGPALVARRLREVEQLYKQQLGAKFPRQLLTGQGRQWRWLMTVSPRAKTIKVLELIVLVGPESARQLLTGCPQLLGSRPEAVAGSLRAIHETLGLTQDQAVALIGRCPEVLLRKAERLEGVIACLLGMFKGDQEAVRQLLKKQPSLLLYAAEEQEGAGVRSLLIAKQQLLTRLLGLSEDPNRILQVISAAPNLLSRSMSSLTATWHALSAALGSDCARAVLTGLPGAGGGSPRLLAFAAPGLSSRLGDLQQLSDLSGDWSARVAAVKSDPGELAVVLAAGEGAGKRIAWLVETQQKRAPGSIGLAELLHMDDEAFRDIYPQWQAPE